MHNLTKIKVFRLLLYITYLPSLIFVYPFAIIKKKNKGKLFFFFDRYVIGGAQRIHIDILHSVDEAFKHIYFTRLSPNNSFKEEFYATPNAEVRDIHFWCDNLLFRLFTVHYYAFYLNRHKGAHVFSSNSTFFYDMLPFISNHVIKTELLHNFTHGKNGMEFFGLANHRYLDNRIVYDVFTYNNIKKQYAENNITESYTDRILFIEPGVNIPVHILKSHNLPLKVLYAGRGGVQKRIPLLNEIAERCIKEGAPLEFHFAGTLMDELSDYVKKNSVIHGEISKQEDMYSLYRNSDIILMTSAYEGFPMLIKEGMANGCIPVVTALEGNKGHLFHDENALLIFNPEDEQHVVVEGMRLIKLLASDINATKRLSENARNYAIQHFDRQKFLDKYREFLLVK